MENVYTATGKRKCAIAAIILKNGTGKRVVNGNTLKEHVKSDTLIQDIEQPLELLDSSQAYDITIKVSGGGLSGQAGAIRLGISRALAKISEENRKILRANGFMTRDSRIVERKKYGLAGARKRFQFSKR